MFRKNQKHQQLEMFSTVQSLRDDQQKLLDGSWAGVFYRELFCRLDERPFAALYSDEASRPNVPVNVLIGLEVLKAGFGWSDAEMYEAFTFNLQVRYALGYRDLSEGYLDIRTVYYFRRRVAEHMQKTGTNLLAQAFAQVTDAQIKAFTIKTGRLRMDSTFIASNICAMSRLHLLVEVLQRVDRMLTPADLVRWEPDFAAYRKGSAHQYVYRVRSEDGDQHMQQIGDLMRRLLDDLAPAYQDEATYQILERVFHEHFVVEPDTRLRLKQGQELSADSLQSPDDPDASFRRKRGKEYTGYAVNVTETCDPENPVQLIVQIQTQPNTVDDPTLLSNDLPALIERCAVDELNTDGGYNNATTAAQMRAAQIAHVQTALRGHEASGLSRSAFAFETRADGVPTTVRCPLGQTATFRQTSPAWHAADFAAAQCAGCPLVQCCPTKLLKRRPVRVLRVDVHDVEIARRRQQIAENKAAGRNLRVAIESTIGTLKHPYPDDRLPVRRVGPVTAMMLACALMLNVRRLWRYLAATQEQEAGTIEATAICRASSDPVVSLSHFLSRLLSGFPRLYRRPALSC
jgi:hypothetical protein